jgi:hypothetical protein
MEPGETGRFLCGECKSGLELRFLDALLTEHVEDPGPAEACEPVWCPFCGDHAIKRLDDDPPDMVV